MIGSTHYDIAARLRKSSMSSGGSDRENSKAGNDLEKRKSKKGKSGPSASGSGGSLAGSGGADDRAQDDKEGDENNRSNNWKTRMEIFTL